MHRGWLAAGVLASAWSMATGCGSRTATFDDLAAGDSGSRGGSGGSSGGSSSGGSSGGSSGSIAVDSGACPSGESLCAGACCGGTCTSGRCLVTLVSGANADELAVDATSVYWTSGTRTSGTLMSVPVAGGSPRVLAAGVPLAFYGGALSLAVNATDVFWISGVDIVKVPVGGGAAPVTLATGQRPNGLAADATTVYWTDDVPPTPEGARFELAATVMSVPAGGGQAVTLASGQYDPSGIAVDAANVYWVDYDTGDVQRTPLQGGAVTTLTTGPVDGYDIALLPLPVAPGVTAQRVCWTGGVGTGDGGSTGGILTAPVTGGTVTTLFAGPTSAPAVDAANVYWATDSALMRVSVHGGTPVTLAAIGGGSIAVDATSVYWVATSAALGVNNIMKLTPK